MPLPVPNLTRVDAAERARLLEVESYDVRLDLTDGHGQPGEGSFGSRTEVRFSCRTPGASTYIDVVAASLTEVSLNGSPVDTGDYASDRGLVLTDLAAENVLVVNARCEYTNTGQGLHRMVDPVDDSVYLYTQFETADAKRCYACFDQPDLKATFTLTVTAPAAWTLISNGRLIGTAPAAGGAVRTGFATTKPISTYITALVAGPYYKATDHHDGIDLGIYCRSSLAEFLDADEIFAVTKAGFDFYHDKFDYHYAFDKYDQLFVPEYNIGAMENAACVTVLEDYVFRSKVTDAAYEGRAETLLHEMAHMWFGDLVTMRWFDDLWLNESFATYVSTLCQAEATKWTNAWTTFASSEKTWAYRQDQLPSTHPIAAEIPDLEAVEVNFDGITYAKGASVLKQLVAYVGAAPFFDAMQGYFRDHEYSNTSLGDLLGALEKSSGRELSPWAAQWLQTAGVNTMRAEYDVDGDGNFTSFAVRQDAPQVPGASTRNVLRDHRLAIGLYAGTPLTRVGRVEIDITGERTDVPELVGEPCPDLVLVNDDDLSYCKLRLSGRSLATVIERVGDIEEALPRALIWAAAWDMCRDGELAARDYLALTLRGIGAESTVSVLQGLHSRARTALTSYADPAWAPAGWAQLAEGASAALHAAAPGSDHQLAWTRLLAAAARSDEHLQTLADLLSGAEVLPGLTVDTELRWDLLHGLVATGRAAEAEIDAEAGRDATAAGAQRAATARALIPTAEAKAAAWRLAVEDESVPNAITAATIAGFAHPVQEELVAPYTGTYFAVIDDVWARRDHELAQNVVQGLYPSVVDQATVDAAQRWLGGTGRPDALRRLVSEGQDTTKRALRARLCDRAAAARAAASPAPSTTRRSRRHRHHR